MQGRLPYFYNYYAKAKRFGLDPGTYFQHW